MENKLVVLRWDELMVDAGIAWLIVRSDLLTGWLAVLVEVSCSTYRFFHSKYVVDKWWLADATLLEVPCQHWPEIGESQIPFLSPKFGTLGAWTSKMALYDILTHRGHFRNISEVVGRSSRLSSEETAC
jgi:hypothetical protein